MQHGYYISYPGYTISKMRPPLLAVVLMLMLLAGCTTDPPQNITNSCDIFVDKGGWYRDAKRAQERWGTPIHVQLAIMYQESKFVGDARPPRDHILWIIPWGRISSAYGYAQAKDSTWEWYKDKTGNRGADRDDFEDAVDFIALCSYEQPDAGTFKVGRLQPVPGLSRRAGWLSEQEL